MGYQTTLIKDETMPCKGLIVKLFGYCHRHIQWLLVLANMTDNWPNMGGHFVACNVFEIVLSSGQIRWAGWRLATSLLRLQSGPQRPPLRQRYPCRTIPQKSRSPESPPSLIALLAEAPP